MPCCAEPSVFSSPGGAEFIGIRMHVIEDLGPQEIRNVASFDLFSSTLPGKLFPFLLHFFSLCIFRYTEVTLGTSSLPAHDTQGQCVTVWSVLMVCLT